MVIRQTEKMTVLSLLWSAQGRPWRGAVCQSWFNRRKRAFHGLQKNVGGKGWVGYLSSARSLMLSLTLICFGVGGPALARADGELSPGMAAPEFELANLMDDTQRRGLKDYSGQVVYLDFWASWCGPCRRENPNVVRAYGEYQQKGFEVFSVSLDKDAARWKSAIAQDGLIWPNHVSDLNGWQNAAARSYGVTSIPHVVLVDQDGIIAATHLRGPALSAKLNELLR